jgi:hypothetical protein
MTARGHVLFLGIAGLLFAGTLAHADNEPVVVIPGRPMCR